MSFGGQSAFFLKLIVVQWISCQIKKVSPWLNLKYQTHPEVNFGSLEVILRSFGGQNAIFLQAHSSSMDNLPNKKSKPLA